MTGFQFDKHLTNERLQLLVGSISEYAIYMLDPEGRVVTWNAGAQRFKGYFADEIIGQHFSCFFRREDRDAGLPGRALRIAARDGRFEAEGWRVRRDGSEFWAHAILDPIRDDDGELLGYAKITRDITEVRKREQALFDSEVQFRMLVQSVRDYAIYMLDIDGHVTSWNLGAETIKGYKWSEIVGQHFSRFYTHDDQASGAPTLALQTAFDTGKFEAEARRVRKDGSPFWAHVIIEPIYNDAGEHVGFAKVTRDITEKKRLEDELTALARQDGLTGLGNRRLFDETLAREWRRTQREQMQMSLLMIDVDHFKQFNDEYGHLSGDDCLRAIAKCVLAKIKRPGDAAFRYGGEELAVILANTDSTGAQHVAERIRASVVGLSVPHGSSFTSDVVTVSIGVGSAKAGPQGAVGEPSELIRAADLALYKAKHAGRNRVMVSDVIAPPAASDPA
ncbi:diguanylate cyclase [Novosphingobium sp. 9U]|uniref:sensor domain-containing diguanylate cyclase n=1 Tax=Novosphingobium sp. 9U TaxID=2653158 RepID=UPI0012F2821A|nr:diguanylate cyclase [Novosphingobium sp. 9U]VWX54026.1 putative Diguanylate cyclase [Novosphingobium sp. 9U]